MEYLKDIIESTEDGVIQSSVDSTEYYLPLRRLEFGDDKEYKRFIKSVERLVRGSLEYKEFISFCRETLQATKCLFTGWDLDETEDIELHHHPFTLYDIVRILVDDHIANHKEFSTFDIALKTIELHFNMKVGIVPLAGTLHKAYHAGTLKIPIEFVIGDYRYYENNFQLASDLMDKLDQCKAISINNEEYLHMWEKFGLRNIEDMMKSLPNIIENDGQDPQALNIPKLGD